MTSLLLAAVIAATPAQTVNDWTRLPATSHWSLNLGAGSVFTIVPRTDQSGQVLTSQMVHSQLNVGFPSQGFLQMKIGESFVDYLRLDEYALNAQPIHLRHGTYRILFNTVFPQPQIMYTLGGYYAPPTGPVAGLTEFLALDRLWQYFPPVDGPSFLTPGGRHVLTGLNGRLGKMQPTGGAVDFARQPFSASIKLPGIILPKGEYVLGLHGGTADVNGFVAYGHIIGK